MKKLLALLLLSPLVSGEECVGLPGKEFQECLKGKMSTTPNAIELECTKITKSKDVFFNIRLIRLLPKGDYGEIESVLWAEKLKSTFSSTGVNAYIHDSSSRYRLSKTVSEYKWNDLPDYEGVWQDSNGEPSQGLLRHLQKPHNTFRLNRETLKLTQNSRDNSVYQCELTENINSRKLLYENEVNLVISKQQELNQQKNKEQERKNKI
jgi:hypothetical protein